MTAYDTVFSVMCLINATCCCVGVKCVFVYRVRGIHENTGLRLAGRELFRLQLAPILAAECILSRVVTLFANPVEHGAERITRGSIANNTGPLGIMPGYAEGEVLGDFHVSNSGDELQEHRFISKADAPMRNR